MTNEEQQAATAALWGLADYSGLAQLPDATVDVVLSAFGVIFAPRPEVALAQLRRVLVPGGPQSKRRMIGRRR
jgi:ubiquinone/menaquinone biosynthesis C-methylase UbiE